MAFTKELIEGTLNKIEYNHNNVDVCIAPTFVHLHAAKSMMAEHLILAAQNCSLTGFGAFTGETSADHLLDMGIKWTILGHSERRSLYGECSNTVAAKTKFALDKGLHVILCIGENL